MLYLSSEVKSRVIFCCKNFATDEVTDMPNILLFAASAWAVKFGIKIALAVIALVCLIFITVVVMMQSGNSDGMEAMMGSSKSDESETYYGKNAGSRKEARLKLWTYICAGIAAVCCIVFIILL